VRGANAGGLVAGALRARVAAPAAGSEAIKQGAGSADSIGYMAGRRPILLVWCAVGLLCAVLLLGTARPLATAWRCWLDWNGGEHAPAEVVAKLESPNLVLRIEGGSQAGQACTADTSAAHHAALEIGTRLAVVYRHDRPGNCELEATLANSVHLMLALTSVVVVLVLFFVLVGLILQRSLGRRALPAARLPVEAEQLVCPGCGGPMEEGALVPMGGVHWRRVGEPVGLPSALGGLAGTVGWRSRPCLHAARCPACQVVTFRYGQAGAATAPAAAGWTTRADARP